mgnify:CR=1 FL=1
MKNKQKETNRRKKQIWILAWAQTILSFVAVAFAISAAIIAYLGFTKSDSEFQKQIIKQTEISDKLQKQIDLLTNQYKFQIEQYQQNTKQRRSDVKPNISLKINYWDPNSKFVYGTFTIIGRPAKFIKYVSSKDNNFNIDLDKNLSQDFILSGNLEIVFEAKSIENPVLDFTLYYEDIDGKIHSSRFHINKTEELLKSQVV